MLTDGYVTVEKEAFELVRSNLNNANVFSFGIGTAVNRHLMEGLARAGQGEAFIVTNSSQAADAAERFRGYIESPVWTHLKLKIDGLDAYDLEPATLPDLFASRPVVLIGKWRGEPKGSITVEGYAGNGIASRTVHIGADNVATDTSALRYLWARSRIAALADTTRLDGSSNEDIVNKITGLGLNYNLLTDGRHKWIVRVMDRPTRMLHPSADCFRALGYHVATPRVRIDQRGENWRCFIADSKGKQLNVCERIFDANGGRWTDASSWYWSALFSGAAHTEGPWWAVTKVEPRE